MITEETPTADRPDLLAIAEEGFQLAASLSHPVMRERHCVAWIYRLSALDPRAAGERIDDATEDAGARLDLLGTVCRDLVRKEAADLEPFFSRALEVARAQGPEDELRALNDLSEVAVTLFERDAETGRALAALLVPATESLVARDAGDGRTATLALALVGEALLVMGDDRGRAFLAEAERRCRELEARDPLLVFLANTLSEQAPEHAAALAAEVQDPVMRLEARLQIADKLQDPADRGRVFDGAEEDAFFIAHMQGPEAIVRLAHAMVGTEPDRARELFRKALEAGENSGSQMQALHWTGVATAVAELDREWAGRIFRESVAAAAQDEERTRRIAAYVLIANEMAGSHPREAADLFVQAMQEGEQLEALWEYAHILDLVFRTDRSPYLDISPAKSLIERVLDRLSDDDPRIPGVLGLPEVSRWMEQVDPEAGIGVLQRWLSVAAAGEDTEGMTQAALALHRCDAEQGKAALRRVFDVLMQRIDCPSMGDFSRAAAGIAPEIVTELAPHIPDRRERGSALAQAARGLYAADPARALALIRDLERPVDRSSALLNLVDDQLGTGDRYQPQPLLEDLP